MKRLFFIYIAIMLSANVVNAQKFDTHKIHFTSDGLLSQTVKVSSNAQISIKKDNRYSWADYKIENEGIYFSVLPNNSNNTRTCNFILLDRTGKAVDTLTVIQVGKIKTQTTNSKNGEKATATNTSSSTKSAGSTTQKSSYSKPSKQCAATTKKGRRCSRNAEAGSIYCWQHKR